MRKTEQDHISKVGKARFHKALVMANMVVREDARFIGLDKVRSEIAFTAALKATGYKVPTLMLSERCGPPDEATQLAAEELLARAVAAVKE